MKKVKVTLTGEAICMEYCSQTYYEGDPEQDFLDNYYCMSFLKTVDALYVDDDWDENFVKQKGKYLKTKEYITDNLMGMNTDHPIPVDVHIDTHSSCEFNYEIELNDDEEFDIKKLQLVKSDYEVHFMPYAIIVEYIMYDNKKIEISDPDVLAELYNDGYESYTVDYALPYVK